VPCRGFLVLLTLPVRVDGLGLPVYGMSIQDFCIFMHYTMSGFGASSLHRGSFSTELDAPRRPWSITSAIDPLYGG